jgi:hypothetical protein
MALFFICGLPSDTSHVLFVILSILVTEETNFADFIFEHKLDAEVFCLGAKQYLHSKFRLINK